MKRFNLFSIFVLVLFAGAALAQTTPQTQPAPNQAEEMRKEMIRLEQQRRLQQQGMTRLKAISEIAYRGKMFPTAIINDVRDLYREPTEKELKSLEPAAADLIKYKKFLEQKRTGIVRLVEDAGCGDSTKTISAASECIKYSMPGHGSWFSFREANYRLGRLADLGFASGNFNVGGVLQHSLLTGIGDIPLEEVRLDTNGLRYINDFRPVDSMRDAATVKNQLSNLVERDGYVYAQALRAVESMTYVLRSVAYRGNHFRSIGGVLYDELDFDNRLDVTVAFRIIRRDEDGSVTLLWKELARKPAPVLKREKKAPAKADPSKYVAAGQ